MRAPRPIVVLGRDGRLAAALLERLGSRGIGLNRAEADITRPREMERTLRALRPGAVVNCAAYNEVDAAERMHERALAVNAAGPAALARLAATHGWRLLHFSTDYVFGGDGLTRPRHEGDPPHPANFYGYSKLLGEQAVLREAPTALVARVANLYGEPAAVSRPGLARRMVETARRGDALWVTRGQWLTPTAVVPLAATALALLERGASGLFHLAGSGSATIEEFARLILQVTGLVVPVRIVDIDPRPAPRAPDTRLANTRLAAAGMNLPPWHRTLTDYLVGI